MLASDGVWDVMTDDLVYWEVNPSRLIASRPLPKAALNLPSCPYHTSVQPPHFGHTHPGATPYPITDPPKPDANKLRTRHSALTHGRSYLALTLPGNVSRVRNGPAAKHAARHGRYRKRHT